MKVLFASIILLVIASHVLGQVDGRVPFDGKPITVPIASVPQEAIESGLGGIVRVLVAVDRYGNVTSVRDSVGPGWTCKRISRPDVLALRSAAVEIAKAMRFQNSNGEETLNWVSFSFPRRGSNEKLSNEDVNYSAATAAPQGPSPLAGEKTLSGGVVNGKAISLPKPLYPSAARALKAAGTVSILVLIDENGTVFSAEPTSGHPLLRPAAATAACSAEFSPTFLDGNPVKVSGIITYNFVP